MNIANEQEQVLQGLQKEWGIAMPDTVSEAEILAQLELRIAGILQRGPDDFFQLMYRLDISENKLNNAMYVSATPAADIARLIYNRQLQKIQARTIFQSQPLAAEDEDLKW